MDMQQYNQAHCGIGSLQGRQLLVTMLLKVIVRAESMQLP